MSKGAKAPAVALGRISLAPVDGGPHVEGELGQALPQISDGYGGYTTVERPGRTDLTWWQGRSPQAVTFSIRFDAGATFESREEKIRKLEALAGIGLPDDTPPPHVVFESNGLVPLDQSDPRARGWPWALTLEPAEYERNPDGKRFVAEFNVTLKRLIEDEQLKARSDAAARRAKKHSPKHGPKTRTYTVRTGDTLVSIAAREYGDVDRWQDIAKANKLRDPRAPLHVGRKLRLPA